MLTFTVSFTNSTVNSGTDGLGIMGDCPVGVLVGDGVVVGDEVGVGVGVGDGVCVGEGTNIWAN